MATIATSKEGTSPEAWPSLWDGQHLTQSEFHRRYELLPDGRKYELLDGVVHMAAAERHRHGRLGHLLSMVLALYELSTPGVNGVSSATTILDDLNEPEPDLQLRIIPQCGGQSLLTAEGYVSGPPELVIEVSYSTLQKDLKQKKSVYQNLGVKEYWVVCVETAEFKWFVWPEGERQLDSDGVLRSVAFPGLWLQTRALFQDNLADLQVTLNAGLQQPEHAAFVALLQSHRFG